MLPIAKLLAFFIWIARMATDVVLETTMVIKPKSKGCLLLIINRDPLFSSSTTIMLPKPA